MKKPSTPLNSQLGRNFGGTKSKKNRIIAGAALLLLLPYLGSTLAASVTISGRSGSGSAIEFAQGSQTTIVCDSTITSALDSTYNATLDYFRVDSITLTGINTTSNLTTSVSNAGCGSKVITVTLWKTDGTTTIATIGSTATSATEASFTMPASGTYTGTTTQNLTVQTLSGGSTGITGVANHATSGDATTGKVVLTLPTYGNGGDVDASKVSRIGIETSS